MNTQQGSHWGMAGTLALFLLYSGPATNAEELKRFEFSEPHLGTTVDLTLYAPNESVANQAATAAYARIEELNRILSDYKPDSEIMRVCATAGTGQSVSVSPELQEVLSAAVKYSSVSDGAFDVTIAPVVKLWRGARRLRELPDPKLLQAAREKVGWKNIRLNSASRTVELLKPGMSIDFGAIAKGYIADQARAALQSQGLSRCLVAVAGDISAGDPPPTALAWKIGVAPLDKPNGAPSRYLYLNNCAVSTSGDAFQFVEIAGVRYSHIVDPATGLGLTRRSSVTVVARKGLDADALATTVSVLGEDRGLKLVEETPGTAALFVLATDDGLTTSATSAFKSFEKPPSPKTDSDPTRR